MKLSWIAIYWTDSSGYCSWEGRNLTMQEAKEKAALWGYREPKWWQFWVKKPMIDFVI